MKELKYKDLKFGVNILKTDYVGYKKVQGGIVQLLFPKGTRVMKSKWEHHNHRNKNKLRTDQAIVIMVVPYNWFSLYETLYKKSYRSSMYYHVKGSIYRLGKQIKPNGFNTNVSESCGQGIHFFCTLKEAENYY